MQTSPAQSAVSKPRIKAPDNLFTMRLQVKLWLRRLQLPIGLGLIAILLATLDTKTIWDLASRADPVWLVVAFFVGMAERLLVSYRWHLILIAGGARITYWSVTRLLFVSQAAGSVMFGELSRNAVMLAGVVQSGSDTALGVSSILIERFLAFCVLLSMVTVGILLAPPLLPDSVAAIAWSMAGLVALGFIGLVLAARLDRVASVLRRAHLEAAANWLTKLLKLLQAYRGKTGLLAYNIVLALGVQLLRVAQTAIVAMAIGLDIPFYYLIIFVPIISAATQLPASAGGIGVRELAHVLLLGTVGVEAEAAFALSILTWFVRLGLSLIGLGIYVRYGFGIR